MAQQKSITYFPNGWHRTVACNRCLRKLDESPSGHLTLADLYRIEAALRLRVEACRENDENRKAGMWEGTRRRIESAIKKAVENA